MRFGSKHQNQNREKENKILINMSDCKDNYFQNKLQLLFLHICACTPSCMLHLSNLQNLKLLCYAVEEVVLLHFFLYASIEPANRVNQYLQINYEEKVRWCILPAAERRTNMKMAQTWMFFIFFFFCFFACVNR